MRFFVNEVSLGQVFNQVFTLCPVSTIPLHSTNTPHSSSSKCCSYQKNRWAKPGHLPKRSAILEIGELLLEKHTYLDVNLQSGQRGRPKADGSKSQVNNWAPPQDELADRPSVVTGFGKLDIIVLNRFNIFISISDVIWSLTLREERRLRVFENRVLRRIFGHRREEVKGSGENYIMRSFMICTAHPILFGRSNREE